MVAQSSNVIKIRRLPPAGEATGSCFWL